MTVEVYAEADALGTAGALAAGRTIRQVHVVGGGSQHTLLCQAIADRSGLPVVRRTHDLQTFAPRHRSVRMVT